MKTVFAAVVFFTALFAFGEGRSTNDAGFNLIKSREGFVPVFYDDGVYLRNKGMYKRFTETTYAAIPKRNIVGKVTIGYGHACHALPCGHITAPITQSQALDILRTDLRQFETCVENGVTTGLTDNQFSALVSFVYNIGCTAFRRSDLRTLLNERRVREASQQFKRWNKQSGKVVNGLTRRREAERSLFCSPGLC